MAKILKTEKGCHLLYLYLTGTIVFTVYGQLILKWRIVKYGSMPDAWSAKLIFVLHLFTDGYILSGFMAAFISSLFWMAAMTKTDLSFAYPIITAGLTALTTLLAIALLGETLSMPKILGIALIISGIVVMHYS